ncbi:MAG: lysylphosphatidylglycerol synthase domain-containing protein, partial [Ornithinimicrobium sp.]
ALASVWAGVGQGPLLIAAAMLAYAAAFGVRTAAWTRLQAGLSRGQAWAAIHVSLLGNHVLPLRLGELLRVTSVLRRTPLAPREVIASVVALRLSDLLALMAVAAIATPVALLAIVGAPGAVALAVVLAVGFALACWWLARTRSVSGVGANTGGALSGSAANGGGCDGVANGSSAATPLPGATVLAAALLAWVLESAVLYTVAHLAGMGLSPSEAAGVTAITVFAQVVALTPGGFGTYEAAGTAAMVALGLPAAEAFAVVLLTHGIKTAYAVVLGGVALFAPAPGYWGRWRLPRDIAVAADSIAGAGPASTADWLAGGAVATLAGSHGWAARARSGGSAVPTVDHDSPIVVFLPAYNEQDVIASVLHRIPRRVHGHKVEVVVINDGSTDQTAARAVEAGAEVIDQPGNVGLGAAVRRGLAAAAERDPAAGVYLDADGEYPPEQIGDVVAPVLAGSADYVIGSRFAGSIETMLPHRRLGNLALTRWLRWTARRPDLSDGQSGFRAFSPAALRAAEVVHDYNYAQVLTLDLLGKGFVYAEVPIRYRFRTTGTSFVSLGRYLSNVVPAVHRELNNTS